MNDDLDDKLRGLYDSLPKDEPSQRVDAYIREVALQPGRLTPAGKDWFVSMGAVASVVMVCSLVAWLYTRAPSQFQQAVSTRAPVPAAQNAIPAAAPPPPEAVALLPEMPATPRVGAPMPGRPVSKTPSVSTDAEKPLPEQRIAESSAGLRDKADRGDDLDALRAAPAAPAAAGSMRHDLPTVRLEPQVAAAPPVMAEEKAKKEAAPPLLSVAVEGVSLGMGKDQLANEIGWACPQGICQRVIIHPRQDRYWAMPAQGATQKVLMSLGGVVTAMSLQQSNTEINNVKLAMEKMGFLADRQCPLGSGELLVSRTVGAMVLNLWRDGDVAIVAICGR